MCVLYQRGSRRVRVYDSRYSPGAVPHGTHQDRGDEKRPVKSQRMLVGRRSMVFYPLLLWGVLVYEPCCICPQFSGKDQFCRTAAPQQVTHRLHCTDRVLTHQRRFPALPARVRRVRAAPAAGPPRPKTR
jgi:hypothetical protein